VVSLRASIFGWKVTKIKDAIIIIVEVQSNSKVEIQKAQTIPRLRNPKWTKHEIEHV
jgi:hypothetical protein